jgi:hypothetical protein
MDLLDGLTGKAQKNVIRTSSNGTGTNGRREGGDGIRSG